VEIQMDEDDDSEHEDTLKILESDDDDLITVRDVNEKEEKLDDGKESRDQPQKGLPNLGISFLVELIFVYNILGGKKECKCKEEQSNWTPLVDHLCQKFGCSVKELQIIFNGLETRREVIAYLKENVVLKTSHLKPIGHNFIVRCCDLTNLPASCVPALGGYLNVTVSFLPESYKLFFSIFSQVRAYYFIKHGMKLRHPYFPCVIQYGGGRHQSYFPLEVLQVASRRIKKNQFKW
jgi:hypothetical protein